MIDEGELVGQLYRVPDDWWGFEAFGRLDHPGACVGYVPSGYKATLLKGTDPSSARYGETQVIVEPDALNGLSKTTSFSMKPRVFSARRVAMLKGERRIGTMSDRDLHRMQSTLIRLFGRED